MFEKNSKFKLKITSTIFIFSLLIICSLDAFSINTTPKNQTKPKPQPQLFPDEYSELDDKPTERIIVDKYVLRTLEKSRQLYLQALIHIDKKDTLTAAKYFERAITTLNTLVSYPGIEQNEEFTELAQSIIDDYETFIENIENLDENTSLFIIRDKLYEEIDKYASKIVPDIQTIIIPKDTTPSIAILPYNHKFEIPLDHNELVERNIAFLTTHKLGRKFVQDCIERRSRWFPLFFRIAKEENVPLEIAFLSMIESRLDPNAVSKAKAVGLWQFIRSTGELYGLNANSSIWIDERRDPEKSTRAAMKHLKDLYNEFGDWHLALAAYNCGIGCVRRTIQRSKIDNPKFWDIADKLPRETRNYVPQFIATTKIMLNPEAYGFNIDELTPHEEYKYDTVIINEPVNLTALAKCIKGDEETLKKLNPELIRSITPPDKSTYVLKIPVGTKEEFKTNYALLTPEEKMPLVNHTVQKGETIHSIAKIYNLSPNEIASFNNIKNLKTKLKNGTTLSIPIEQINGKDDIIAKNNDIQNNGRKPNIHIVNVGDNLFQISKKYNVSIEELKRWNNIPDDSDNISVGMELIVSSDNSNNNNSPEITKIKTNNVITHKVIRGENLAQIARKYNVPISTIIEDNNIIDETIYPDQVLKIRTSNISSKNYSTENLTLKTHTVKRGENLSIIAAKYGVNESDIISWNPNKIDGTTIYRGTKLKIYVPETSKGASKSTKSNVNNPPKYYTIRAGDTLYSIAQKFGVTVSSIKAKNKNLNENKLTIGQRIRIQ